MPIESPPQFPMRARVNDAIANAMMHAYGTQIAPFLASPADYLPPDLVNIKDRYAAINQTTKDLTRGNCAKASLIAANYLTKHHPDLFTRMLLLTSLNDKAHPYAEQFTEDLQSTWLVLQDQEGFWHGLSPANHEEKKSTVFYPLNASQDLQEILDQIKANDGGIWPTASYIYKYTVNDKKYHAPISTESPGVPQRNYLRILRIIRNDVSLLFLRVRRQGHKVVSLPTVDSSYVIDSSIDPKEENDYDY